MSGPARSSRDALARLEIIADTYLSVSTPVQVAAARLHRGWPRGSRRDPGPARAAISTAARARARSARRSTLLEPEGGWSAVAAHARDRDRRKQPCIELVDEARVLVHPGYFFDFSEEAFLV